MDSVIILPDLWVPVVSPLIVILTALLVRAEGSHGVRQIVALVLSAGIAVLEQITSAPEFTIEGLLSTFIVAFLSQLGVYLGTKRVIDVNSRIAPTVGITSLPGIANDTT